MIKAVQSFDSNQAVYAGSKSHPVFNGEKLPNTSLSEPNVDTYEHQNGKKDNTVKYAVGIGSIIALVGLGIAGYKGKLGKTIQKWLGGAEKAIEKEAGNAAKGAENAALDTVADKLAKFSEEELKLLSSKTVKDLSDEEFSKLVNTMIGDDRPVIRQIIDKTKLLPEARKSKLTVGNFTNIFNQSKKEITPEINLIIDSLAGKDSILLKQIKDITLGDVKQLVNKFSKIEDLAGKAGYNINIDEGMIKALDMLDSSMKLEDILNKMGKKVNINPNKTGVDIIAQFIRINY